MNVSRIKPAWVVIGVALLGTAFYIGERLYVTPTESVDYTLERVLTALVDEEEKQLDRLLHDALFQRPPPEPVRRFLSIEARTRDRWTRKEFRVGVRNLFERVSVQRYAIMGQEISVKKDTATVRTEILLFYRRGSEQEESDEDSLLSKKFLSSWTIEFTRADGNWKISNLSYGKTK